MAMFGRREAWPAVAILGIGILTLAITLRSAQDAMPVEPQWLLAVLGGLYVVLAFAAGQFTWRAPALLASMLLAHLVMALLMGWGYAAVEGHPRTGLQALVEGLWRYLPGTALQFGFACIMGIILDAHLLGAAEEESEAPAEALPPGVPALPDLSAAADTATALAAAAACPGVAAVLLCRSPEGATLGAGVWERDPAAALGRVRALLVATGSGLNSFALGSVNLVTRSENGHVAALLADGRLNQQTAHALLREVWATGERLAASAPDAGAPAEG